MSTGGDNTGPAAQTDIAVLIGDGTVARHWVLDPASSHVEFHVKHFWGVITVNGSFGKITGEGNVDADGAVRGWVRMDANSLTTKNKKRDAHLRSADFFDVENHSQVVVTVNSLKLTGPMTLVCHGTLEAAGKTKPIQFNAQVSDATTEAVTISAELVLDRREFSMTWSPLDMASYTARATVVARFVRG